MAEYLAPGVYIEEVSFRSKTIEGVSTSTAGFVGPTRFGPTEGEPELLTSLADFERIYGGLDQLRFGGSDSSPTHNYLAHGVRAFFEEGGKRLYVSRVYSGSNGQASIINNQVIDDPAPTNEITLTARFPGRAGNMRITFVPQLSRNLLVSDPVTNERVVRRIQENDTVLVTPTDTFYDVVRSDDGLVLRASDGTDQQISDLDPSLQQAQILMPELSDNLLAQDPITNEPVVGSIQENDRVLVTPGDAFRDVVRINDDLVLRASDGTDQQISELDPSLQQAQILMLELSDNLLVQDPITSEPVVRRIQENDRVLVTPAGSTPAGTFYDVVRINDDLVLRASDGTDQQISELDPAVQQVRILTPELSDNLLVQDPVTSEPVVRRIQENDRLLVTWASGPPTDILYDVVRINDDLVLRASNGATQDDVLDLRQSKAINILTVDVTIERPIIRPKRPRQRYAIAEVLQGFSFHPQHANALTSYFMQNPPSRGLFLSVPFEITSLDSGAGMAKALLGQAVVNALANENATASQRQRVYRLTGGSDGLLPTAAAYRGDSSTRLKSGLAAFEDIEDISIVAAPGYSADYTTGDQGQIETIQAHLINHCHRMRYRVAVLDSPDQQILGGVRNYRGKIDSTHAALYYPWVRILDPITENEVNLPPSGFVAGIYARNDVENGVHKAPANEVVRLSIGFEYMLNKAQQDVLNPEGINCFRFFEGRGYRLWGARTISSDPEWKYLNVRRYFAYLERSIERGTQWAVFENNNTPLWANIRRTIEDFLFNEWRSGRLMGDQPEEAYFVRCDRSTMTQNDIDNGRLICLIGVSPVRPAEFVIFRIGQWTADRR